MKFVKNLDSEDKLLFLGVLLVIGGVAAIYRPAGAIVAGVLCSWLAVLLSGRRLPAEKKAGTK